MEGKSSHSQRHPKGPALYSPQDTRQAFYLLTGEGLQAACGEAGPVPTFTLWDPCKRSWDPLNAGRSVHVASGSTLLSEGRGTPG